MRDKAKVRVSPKALTLGLGFQSRLSLPRDLTSGGMGMDMDMDSSSSLSSVSSHSHPAAWSSAALAASARTNATVVNSNPSGATCECMCVQGCARAQCARPIGPRQTWTPPQVPCLRET